MIKGGRIQSLRKKILTHLSAEPAASVSLKQISKHLRITAKRDLQQAAAIMEELVAAGTLRVDDQGRYKYVVKKKEGRKARKGAVAGVLRMHRRRGGTVMVDSSSDEFVIAEKSMMTAMHGDRVVVVPYARHTGRRGRGIEDRPEGEIVEILERARTTVVGRLEKSGHFFFVVPDDSRIRRDVYVPKEEAERASTGDKVVVRLAPWTDPHLNPEGSIIEVLGPSGNAHAEVLSVARTFGLPESFPDAVVAEAERFSGKPTDAELASRLDMRSVPCFTIDPVDAQDFDDALSIERLKNGNLRLGVHIADVSHFVRQGTLLDREAFERGTSVYMVNEVVPMLPERLSNDLCSLRPDVDRLTFSVMMELNEHGTVGSYEIRKSVIHSARRFTYEEAEETLRTGKGDYRGELRLLQKLAKALYRKRRAKGSLDFDTPEVKFRFDAQGLPDAILKKERLESNRLVEECMLLANVTIARHIGARQKEAAIRPFLYRIHDSPDPDRIKDLSNFVKQFGYSLDVKSGVPTKALQHLLDQVRGTEVEALINKVALRSMAKAVYSPESHGHYGLGFRHYTHFTSPIRRYPDLIVHRLLEEYESPVSNRRMAELKEMTAAAATKASLRERVAVEAERASVKVMQVEYMKRHMGDVLDGVIGGVADFGIFVEVNDLQIEGLVRVRDLSDDYYLFDERQYALKGRSNGKIFRLGDRVKVRVVAVNDREQQIDMLIVP